MLFLVVAIAFTSVLSASTNPTNAEPNVTKEIGVLLKNPTFLE